MARPVGPVESGGTFVWFEAGTRRVWSTFGVALILFLLGVGSALAEGSAPSPLHLTGQAVVIRGNSPQVLLSATASDGSGWRLDLTLVPVGQSQSASGQPVIVLQGTYALSSPKVSEITGPVNGELDQNGNGKVQLSNVQSPGLTSPSPTLTAVFAVGPSSTMDVTLSGPLPAPPPPPGSRPVNHTFWYISRAAGFTAYGLLTLTVCLGLLVHTKLSDALVARWQTFDLHQATALLALAFVVLHVFALLGDQYIGFSIPTLLVPLLSRYRPTQLGLGIVALYLLIVVVGSFYVRRDIGYANWRKIHYLTFGIFALALGHGVFAGTDSAEPWARAVYVGSGLLVLALTYARLQREDDPPRPEPVAIRPSFPHPSDVQEKPRP